MSRVEVIQTQINYNYALFEKLWESIMTLSEDQFDQDVDYSHGSLRAQMIHAAVTEVRWAKGLRGDPNARQFAIDSKAYPSREDVRRLWEESISDMKAYSQSLDENELDRIPPGMPGPVWQVLIHLVNHGTDHRAQILRILHDFGAPTFDQDLIIHLWFGP